MKLKTSTMTDHALDWAVATAEGYRFEVITHEGKPRVVNLDLGWFVEAGESWAQGGPIIEREKIAVAYQTKDDGWEVPNWAAWMSLVEDRQMVMGETALIAAMRCYVASKIGDEVEIPDELIT